MHGLLSLIPAIFPRDEKHEPFHLLHPNMSLSNIMINPDTLKISGIIDWECINAIPKWQDTYPQFLTGSELEKEPARVEPGDEDLVQNEHWDDWEKMQLRRVFLVEDHLAKLKREFVGQIEIVEITQPMVKRWIEERKS